MRRAVVTGGRGWLGVNLVRRLAADGWDVTTFDVAPALDAGDREGGEVTDVVGDITDAGAVVRLMRPAPELVFHLAYLLGPAGQADPRRSLTINCIGTANVFEAACEADARRVVWLSSSAIYGPAAAYGEGLIGEDDVRGVPRLVYGACKRMNEYLADVYTRDRGLDQVAFRLSLGYGPPARRHGFSKHVTTLFEGPFRGHPAVVTFPPAPQNWVYVDDIVDALLLGAEAESLPSRVYNLASDETRTPVEVADMVRETVPDARIDVTMAGEVEWPARLDYRRARAELGYRPKFDLEAGIARYRDLVVRADRAAGTTGPPAVGPP
jgi:UDP-glucose 4-epimerase